MSQPSYVYALKIDDTPFIKIGQSTSPDGRALFFAQKLSKHNLTCRIVCRVNVPARARQYYERALHRHFVEYRVTGEWFYASAVEVRHAMEELIVQSINGDIRKKNNFLAVAEECEDCRSVLEVVYALERRICLLESIVKTHDIEVQDRPIIEAGAGVYMLER